MNDIAELTMARSGARPVVSRTGGLRRSPLAVAGAVMVLYAIWFGAFSAAGYSAQDLVLVSKLYATKSHVSTAIRYDPAHHRYAHNRVGYDGQFFYFIAADPMNARYYVDNAAYRYTKILYPMLARLLAAGRVDLIPYTLLLINWVAAGLGTALVAAWLCRRGVSPWLALAYGLYPGIFLGFQRDLTEPLSYALVALAIYLFDFGGRGRVLVSAGAFALAALTRDKAIIFALMYSLALFFQNMRHTSPESRARQLPANAGRAALMAAIAVGPLALWKVFLLHWMRSMTLTQEAGTVTPFKALGMHAYMNGATAVEVLTVTLPGLLCGAMAAWALYRGEWNVKVWTLLVVVFFSVITLDPQFYKDLFGMLRVSTAVVISALYCIPIFDRLTGERRAWLWASLAAWMPIPLAFACFGPLFILHGHG